MDWYAIFSDYGLFLLKTVTLVIGIVFALGAIITTAARERHRPKEHLEITNINDRLKDMNDTLNDALLSKDAKKQIDKEEKKAEKSRRKAEKKQSKSGTIDQKPRTFVLDFDGDIKAQSVDCLREEITAILQVASDKDEVLVRLESPGGMVHAYGLAASQLDRIRSANIPLNVCVDKVAASGGYMMACVANNIYAAPFAIIGSIGVLAEIPNFHRLLKEHKIDYELHTAGEYKRTLTVFGENTEEGREKFQEELQQTHELFKQHIEERRPELDINRVATGEHWYGTQALALNLIDGITTSDDYLTKAAKDRDVYRVKYEIKASLGERFAVSIAKVGDALLNAVLKKSRPAL